MIGVGVWRSAESGSSTGSPGALVSDGRERWMTRRTMQFGMLHSPEVVVGDAWQCGSEVASEYRGLREGLAYGCTAE